MKNLKFDGPFILLLLIFWAILHHQILWDGHVFSMLDSSRFFFPLWKWGAAVLGNGRIPLWNSDAGFGTPYLADPEMSVFYPPKFFLYQWMGPVKAFNFLVLGHHLWSLLGFWVFARRKSFERHVAFLGCLAFGFSFNLVCLTWTPTALFAFSWIPWVFWAAEGLWEGKGCAWLWFSVFGGLQWAAGYPIYAYLTYLALVLDGCLRVFPGPSGFFSRKMGGEKILLFGLASLLTGVSNAVWAIPFMEFRGMSNVGMRLEMPQGMTWGNLATWFNPFYVGHPLFSTSPAPFFTSVYFFGLPSLVMMIGALFSRKTPNSLKILWWAIFVMSLGESLGVGGWLKEFLPAYEWVVRSGYWIPMVLFVGAQLVMEGLQKLEAPGKKTGLLLLALGVFGAAHFLGVPWDLGSFWLSLLFFTMALSARVSGRMKWIFLLGAFFLSQGPVLRSINFSMDHTYYDRPPNCVSGFKVKGRIFQPPDLLDRESVVSGESVAGAYDKLKTELISNWPLAWGLEEACWTNTIFLRDFLPWCYAPERVSTVGAGKIIDYLGIRYIQEGPGTTGGFSVFLENPSAGPKWFSVQKAVLEESWAADLKRIESKGFLLSNTCFAENPADVRAYSLRRVSETARSEGQIALEADGGGEALVVSNETAYPGWVGTVEGREGDMERVNHGFRAIRLHDGEQRALISYRPVSFRLGCFLSLLVIGVWAAVLLNALGLFWRVPHA